MSTKKNTPLPKNPSFWSRLKSFFFGTSKKKVLRPIGLAEKNLYKYEIRTYKDLIQNTNEYRRLIKNYSSIIANRNQIVSVSDGKLNPEKYIIELKNISKYYLTERKVRRIFFDINFKIEHGKFVVILGPSGSGKTTLLNIMSGIDQADTGDVFIKQKNLTLLDDSALTKFRKDHVGLIFQQYNLLKNLSAVENVRIGANLAPDDKETIPVEEVLKLLEIDHIAESYITELSGGEQQRFSIARGLVKNPDILFCDEPTGALDHEMSKKVLKMLQDINEKYKTTIVLITHNENFTKIADIVIRFSDGKVASKIQNEKKISALKL